MMCYYSNVHFQGQRVKSQFTVTEVSQAAVRIVCPMSLADVKKNEVVKLVDHTSYAENKKGGERVFELNWAIGARPFARSCDLLKVGRFSSSSWYRG